MKAARPTENTPANNAWLTPRSRPRESVKTSQANSGLTARSSRTAPVIARRLLAVAAPVSATGHMVRAGTSSVSSSRTRRSMSSRMGRTSSAPLPGGR